MWDVWLKMPYNLAIIQYFYQTKPSFCIFCGSEKLPDDINSEGDAFRWLLMMWSGFVPFPGPFTPPPLPPPWFDALWFIKPDSGVIPPNSFTIGIELGWSIGPVASNEKRERERRKGKISKSVKCNQKICLVSVLFWNCLETTILFKNFHFFKAKHYHNYFIISYYW